MEVSEDRGGDGLRVTGEVGLGEMGAGTDAVNLFLEPSVASEMLEEEEEEGKRAEEVERGAEGGDIWVGRTNEV